MDTPRSVRCRMLTKTSAGLLLLAAGAILIGWFVRKDHYGGIGTSRDRSRPPDPQVVGNQRYSAATEGDKNLLDLYIPRGRKGFPVLLFIHGGSWVQGSKEDLAKLGMSFARHGLGVAVVNYRLSPQVRHPAHIQDVASAFAWIRANLARYGGRTDQIFVSGHSAGGHLAALLGSDESYLKAEHLSFADLGGVIPIGGEYDIRPGRWPEVFGDGTDHSRDPSPSHHIDGKRPPFLILSAEHDSPGVRRQSDELCSALRARSSEAASIVIKNRGHASIVHEISNPGDVTRATILAFIERHAAP
jgi:acetyl esterase/lipase